MLPSDELLIQSCNRGNQHHCRMIFERYKRLVANIIYRFFGNLELVPDLTQDVFLKVYRGLNKFRGDTSLKNWIGLIATNTCRDQLRQKNRLPADTVSIDFQMDDDEHGPTIEIADDEENTDSQFKMEQKQRDLAIRQEVKKLKEIDRMVLLMWLGGKKYDEIAKRTGIPRGTVGSKISEIKRKLKNKLGKIGLGL